MTNILFRCQKCGMDNWVSVELPMKLDDFGKQMKKIAGRCGNEECRATAKHLILIRAEEARHD